MELPPYEFRVIASPDAHTMRLTGEIDYAASLDIMPELREITKQCCDRLLLDLDDVTFIDSEGIKLLLAAAKWMKDRQGQAQVVRCSACVHRVLKLVGLECLIMDGALTTTVAVDR